MNNILLYEMTKYLRVQYGIEIIGCINKYFNYNIFNALSGRNALYYKYTRNNILVDKLYNRDILSYYFKYSEYDLYINSRHT